MTTIGEQNGGEVRIFTFKEGLLSAIAHDLEIAVERFSITWDDARTSVSATFDATSLRVLHPVVHGRASPGTLSARDLAKIEHSIASDVLRTNRFREVRFASSAIEQDGDGLSVRGTLELCGRSNEITARVRRDGATWTTEVVLDQPRWGITPYSAMMGTLKIKPEVRVRVRVPAT
jgi:polyisoprenoid-binding protein YceI